MINLTTFAEYFYNYGEFPRNLRASRNKNGIHCGQRQLYPEIFQIGRKCHKIWNGFPSLYRAFGLKTHAFSLDSMVYQQFEFSNTV